VEVKIGVQFAARELVLESTESAAEVEQAVTAAVTAAKAGVLVLTDDKGRKVVVPADKLAYVEIGPEAAARRVGFAAS
jgi:hypothetical protein